MTTNKILEKINRLTRSRKLNGVEEKRLIQDLDAVYKRLDRKEYRKFSYAMNSFDVPERTRQIYTEVEFYTKIGKTWEQLLKQVNVRKYKKIVDICPGFTPKVELGLYYLGYTGEIVILDKDTKAITQLKNFMDLFNPQFAITKLNEDLFKPSKQKFELVTANHVIDDLVLAHFAGREGISLYDLYETEGEFSKLWKTILENEKSSIEKIVPVIVDALTGLVDNQGTLILSQYTSYMEKLLRLKEISAFNKKVFRLVISELTQKGFVNDVEAVEKALYGYKGHFGKNDCAILVKKSYEKSK